MTLAFWIVVLVELVLGFALRILARRMMPVRQWTRFALVLGWPWITFVAVFFIMASPAELADPRSSLAGFGFVAFMLAPYYAGYSLEWIWRVTFKPSD